MTLAFAASVAMLMVLFWCGLMGYSYRLACSQADSLLLATDRRIGAELEGASQAANMAELVEEDPNVTAEGVAAVTTDSSGRLLNRVGPTTDAWIGGRGMDWRVRTMRHGGYSVTVGVPWRPTERALRAQGAGLAAFGLLVVVASAIGAWVVVGRTLSPIAALADQAGAATAEHLHVALSAPSDDTEIVGLVGTLNELLDRLARTAEARGRFYAAASHELRTPLQALQGHLELSLSRDRSADERLQTIREAHAQTRRLASLVADVLTLNRIETATAVEADLVDVGGIVEAVSRPLLGLAEERGLSVEIACADAAIVRVPAPHLEMMVRNLVENAVRYATPGGAVRIAVSERAVRVYNDFAGASRPDFDRLFEPFARLDEARRLEPAGNGLGLAICRAIARADNLDLNLCQDEHGVTATVVLRDASTALMDGPDQSGPVASREGAA